ncbi:MAG: type II toxin-antitoxin system RelE/ParE family toxin [Pseudomonadota bacterium]
MDWIVEFHEAFAIEFAEFHGDVKTVMEAHIALLATFGPQLSRPQADTLNGSRHANMKELRFKAADGVWRVAFAFDPDRKAILLVGGNKSGSSATKFYRRLIKKADERFDDHLSKLDGKE